MITASVDTGDTQLPVSLFVCNTDASAQCLQLPAPEVTIQIGANGTPTYSVFVDGAGQIPLNAAINRVFVRFKESGGVSHGSRSVATRTVAN